MLSSSTKEAVNESDFYVSKAVTKEGVDIDLSQVKDLYDDDAIL